MRLLLTLPLLWVVAMAQAPGLRNVIPVYSYGLPLHNAWAGGLDAPQFSNLDLDGDSRPDLFVFDRADGSILLFRQAQMGKDSMQLVLTSPYVFPKDLNEWALLQDYDCDGQPDLLTNNNSNIDVYRLGSDKRFRLTYSALESEYSAGFRTALYSAAADLPAFADREGDGDLDIFVYTVGLGDRVEWHRNMAVEQLGRCDTFVLRLESSCWGRFIESYNAQTNTFTLELKKPCASVGKTNHTGGTLLISDLNADGRVDLLASDIGVNNVVAGYNYAGPGRDSVVTQDFQFPSDDVPADITYFPAPYMADVDADGRKDLLLAPNATAGIDNAKGVVLYKNEGKTDSLDARMQAQGWLQNTMIDNGQGAMPLLADMDNDGDLDLLVGSEGTNRGMGEFCQLQYYRNDGSPSAPVFIHASDDLLNIAQDPVLKNYCGYHPATAELNGDSQPDLVLGTANGILIRLLNTTPQGANVPTFGTPQANWLNLDQLVPRPSYAAPTFADVDADGDADLVVGTGRGRLLLYRNDAGAYNLQNAAWGNVRTVDSQNLLLGYACPVVTDLDRNGQPDLLVGNASGRLIRYSGLSSATFDSLPDLVPDPYSTYARPALGRLYADDSLDLILGTRRGGLLHMRLAAWPVSRAYATPGVTFGLHPNPAGQQAWLYYDLPQTHTLYIYSMDGRLIHCQPVPAGQGQLQLDMAHWPQGVYIVRLGNALPQRLVHMATE